MTKEIYKSVLKRIVPSDEENKKLANTAKKFSEKLNVSLKQYSAKIIIGGSLAKNTWLTKNNEVDVFVSFPFKDDKVKASSISNILKKCLESAFKGLTIDSVNGSREYFHITIDDILFEIIPIIEIQNAKEALNITDISPLHAKWVNSKGDKICNEIRLAKQFAKAAKVYGAESYISGFSGYILEILVIYYGSFEELLKESLKWKSPVIIDVEKHFPKHMVFFELNKSKLQSPIIIVDPVDKRRNASAALSVDKFKQFKKCAKIFLENPNDSLFEIPIISHDELILQTQTKKLQLIYFELKAEEGKRDVVGARLLKVFNLVKEKLKVYTLKKADWEWSPGNKAKMYFFVSKKKQPKTKLVRGPPINVTEHVEAFRKKHEIILEKDGFLYTKIQIKHPLLDDYVKSALENDYCKERFETIELMKITYSAS